MERVATVDSAPAPVVEAIGCQHCGLATRGSDAFCCFGCELAAQIAREAETDHAGTRNTLTFALLLTMSVMMLSLFLYAEDIYDVAPDAGLAWMRTFYRYASAVLATPVVLMCGIPLARRAMSRLRGGHLSMSALIVLGASAAYALSLMSLANGGRQIYFDSATAALVLATLGRYLEASARTHASGMVQMGPATLGSYEVQTAEGVALGALPANRIVSGMVVRVPVERTVPVDLSMTSGTAEVDVGVLHGESRPRVVGVGDVVPSGAVPIDRELVGAAVADSANSTLERLSALAKSLQESPSALLVLADRFARLLTPVVWLIASATLLYWWQVESPAVAVTHALAVVLVACPCTYAIATPLVHWLAMRRALAEGIAIRDAEVLERLADVDVVAFDKTGTLTDRDLQIEATECTESLDVIRGLVAALECGTRHPIGQALFRWAHAEPDELTDRRAMMSVGVEGRDSDNRLVRIARDEDGETVLLTRDKDVLARFTVIEALRQNAEQTIEKLRAMNILATVLTGDGVARAQIVSDALKIPFSAGLRPADKVAALRELGTHVAMVGDGVNDAPALAGVAVGISMSTGTDLSRGLARVNLLADDLTRVPVAIAIARHAQRTARRLLLAATAYNVVFIGLAAMGLLRPVFAGLSMLLSSLLTIAFASRDGSVT